MRIRTLAIYLCIAAIATHLLGCNSGEDQPSIDPFVPDSVLIGGRVVEARNPDIGIPMMIVQLADSPKLMELTGKGGYFTIRIPTERLVPVDDDLSTVYLYVTTSTQTSGKYGAQRVTREVWSRRDSDELITIQMVRKDDCGSSIEPPRPEGRKPTAIDSILGPDPIKADSTQTQSALPTIKQGDRRLAWL